MIFRKLYISELKTAFGNYLSDKMLSEILNDVVTDEKAAFKLYWISKTSNLKRYLNSKFPTLFPISEKEYDALMQVDSMIKRHINKDKSSI